MFDWVCVHDKGSDERLGVKVGNLVSANDGDVCIAALLTEILPTLHDPLCLDVGADEGWWSLFVKHVSPNAKCIAFEPNPNTLPHLKENLKLTDVTIIEKAVSDEEVLMFDFTGPSSNSRGTGIHEVACVPLTQFISAEPIVIKIDTEGHDIIIVKSLLPNILSIHTLIFEFSMNWYENKMEAVNVVNHLIQQYPYSYMLSRRGNPVVFDISRIDIEAWAFDLNASHTQVDLCFTKSMIQSIPIIDNHT